MLIVFTVVIMLVVAYAFFLQGLLTAFTMLVNVFLAGLVAFNFWEPIAKELERALGGSPVVGYEDFICLIVLFCVTLVVLRVATNSMSRNEPELPPAVQQGGAVVCGLLTGYLAAGFLTCALQTLPIEQDFFGFSARVEAGSNGLRGVLPPDRVWLALVRRGSVGPLSADGDGFDPRAYFELGYQRHRRFGEKTEPQRYAGEDVIIQHGD
jgi:hypothetical protein